MCYILLHNDIPASSYGLLEFASMSILPKFSINHLVLGLVDSGHRQSRHAC